MTDDSRDREEALRETLRAVLELGEANQEHLEKIIGKVAPEDLAQVLSDFSEEEKLLLFKGLPTNEARGIAIEATDPQSQGEILEGLNDEERMALFGELPLDDLVDQLVTLPRAEQAKVIAGLETEEAREVEELRRYAPDTAGGMMNTEFITVDSHFTSRQALETIQGNLNLEVIAYVYVVDEERKLCGVASIRGILEAQPETPITAYMAQSPIAVTVDTDQEEVAAYVDKYNFAAIPVIDPDGRMKGLVTYDDVIDVVQEEHSEDMLRMAGTVAIHPFHESVWKGVFKRLPFLLVTMFGGLGILVVMKGFKGLIEAEHVYTISILLIPLLVGLSGNVAIVTSTIVVRGFATGEISRGRLWRALVKEVWIGVTLGILLGLLVALCLTGLLELISGIDGGEPQAPLPSSFRWVPALALGVSVAFAAFLGGIVPVLCKLTRRIDPAIASGPFVTMLCDLSVSVIFLTLVFLLL